MSETLKKAVLDTLEKQYTYTNISDLLMKREEAFSQYIGDMTDRFTAEIVDFEHCSHEALVYFWGKLFKVNENFKDAQGNVYTLTDDQFREVIRIRAFGTTWDGSIDEANVFFNNIFKDRGKCYVKDPKDMSYMVYSFEFFLDRWERWLFQFNDVLPRPAGVQTSIQITNVSYYFGFKTYAEDPTQYTTGFNNYNEDNPYFIVGKMWTYETRP